MKRKFIVTQAAIAASAGMLALGSANAAEPVAQKQPEAKAELSSLIKRGEYLVTIGGCNDCHTPLKMGPNGPAPDMTRMLSGHPEAMKLPPAPKLPPGPWMTVGAATNTAWSGPWGVSYAANLTPDKATGLGNWNEKTFTEAMRTGKHLGKGRPLLPPMPWFNVARLSDEDMKAVFAFLQAVPAVKNKVPEPLPPEGQPGAGQK